jgi:hypothetical protein
VTVVSITCLMEREVGPDHLCHRVLGGSSGEARSRRDRCRRWGRVGRVGRVERLGMLDVRTDAVPFRHELARGAVEGPLTACRRMLLKRAGTGGDVGAGRAGAGRGGAPRGAGRRRPGCRCAPAWEAREAGSAGAQGGGAGCTRRPWPATICIGPRTTLPSARPVPGHGSTPTTPPAARGRGASAGIPGR